MSDSRVTSRDSPKWSAGQCLLTDYTTTLLARHTSLYISLRSQHDYDVKMPNFTFYGGRTPNHNDFFFLFLNLDVVLRNSTPEEFANI